MGDEPEVCTKISEKVKMAGFLEKKGSMLWKRYWFVLEDKLLLYYKSQLEYINLSPCRGSVNMNLVSTVQPRRNSREPIIHLVSRSQNLILKAQDRLTQEKWLQSLLDSIGKQGMASLRFSLDDLPGEIQTMTLPRRWHGGSLDAVWKPPVIPKTRMLDKVLGWEEEPDENQNTDSYDSLTKERKSQTLDTRRMDSKLEKLRNAIGRRKSSTALKYIPEMEKPVKTRHESFLRKMFKKKTPKVEREFQQSESDLEEIDPLYDTIDHAKTTTEPVQQKPMLSPKILLPEGTLEELKTKLRSKENLATINTKGKEPPELPPRGFSLSQTNLETTTEAVVHQSLDKETAKEVDDSEDSEVSGHYQTIKKPGEEKLKKEPEEEETQENNNIETKIELPVVEAEYQVINKNKKKKDRESFKPPEMEKVVEVLQIEESGESPEKQELSLPMEDKTSEPLENVLVQIIEPENEAIFMVGSDKENSYLENENFCELNNLLLRLTEITTAPLTEREGFSSWSEVQGGLIPPKLQRSQSDPDYDIPRPHAPLVRIEQFDKDRIPATEFFNKVESLSSGSTNSLEPDSLEAKKSNFGD